MILILAVPLLLWSGERELPVPNAAQLAWQQAELGVIFHYDLHVFDGVKYNQQDNRITPVSDYNVFNPQYLNTDQWIEAARDMGARFALLTATHETGFALYQSDVNPYCLKAVKWRDGKGDMVRDFIKSCRKFGIKPGIYLGIRWNSFFGVHNFRVEGKDDVFTRNRQKYYNSMVEGMVREICTRYGDLFEIWFDGGAYDPAKGAPDVLPIVKRYQPGCLFYHNSQLAEARWGGSESGTVAYPCWSTFPFPSTDGELYPQIPENNYQLLKTGDAEGRYWMPAMADAPLRGFNGRHEWFWEPGDEAHIFPLENLLDMYYKSVGRNSTLILGITPDPDGLIPEPDVRRMREFGRAIAGRFADPVGQTSGQGRELELDLRQAGAINHIVLQEDITRGERVRRFRVQGRTGSGWQVLEQGSCIGHKRIIKTEEIVLSGLRLLIDQAVAEPYIKNFSVYYATE